VPRYIMFWMDMQLSITIFVVKLEDLMVHLNRWETSVALDLRTLCHFRHSTIVI
jgi:hypothetical protein